MVLKVCVFVIVIMARMRIARGRGRIYVPICKIKEGDDSDAAIMYKLMVKKTAYGDNDDDCKTLLNTILGLHGANHKFLLWHYRYFLFFIKSYVGNTDHSKIILNDEIMQLIKITFSYHKAFTKNNLWFLFDNNYYNDVTAYCIDVLFDTGYKFNDRIIYGIAHVNYFNRTIEKQDYVNNNALLLFVIYMSRMINKKVDIDVAYFNNFVENVRICDVNCINVGYIMMLFEFLKNYNNVGYNIKGLYRSLLKVIENNVDCVNKVCNIVTAKNSKQIGLLECILQNNVIVGKFFDNINIGYLNKNLILLFYALHCGYKPDCGLVNRLLDYSEDANCGKLILDNDCSNYITMSFNKSVKVIDYIDVFGGVMNNDMLNIALEKGYMHTSKLIIDKLGILPNIDTLNMGAKSGNLLLIKELLGYRMVPDENTLMNVVLGGKRQKDDKVGGGKVMIRRISYRRRKTNRRAKAAPIEKAKVDHDIIIIAKMLRDHGLVINLRCVSMLLSLGLYFDDLSIYGINYDEDLYFECFINDCYPDVYMNKFTISKNVIIARRFYKNNINGIDNFVKFIRDNNVVIDNYILDAVMCSDNGKLIKELFTKNKCVVPKVSLYKMTNRNHNINALRNYVNVVDITKDIMMVTCDVKL